MDNTTDGTEIPSIYPRKDVIVTDHRRLGRIRTHPARQRRIERKKSSGVNVLALGRTSVPKLPRARLDELFGVSGRRART